jgi:hypothetical protein
VEILEEPSPQPEAPLPEAMSPFDLGALTGKTQAFGIIANRTLVVQAQSLKAIRESRSFETLGLNWDQFCESHAGISRSYADKLIHRLEEFGEAFFKLAQVARVSPEFYRVIAPAISDDGIEIDGETLAFVPENAPRIRQAIRSLQERLSDAQKPAEPPSIVNLQTRLDACFNEMSILSGYPPSRTYHPPLRSLVVYCQNKLQRIADRIPEF